MRVIKKARLVQVFLSQGNTPGPGIFEVSNTPDGTLLCTCAGFKGRKTCKHTKFVQARMDANNGNYPIEISSKVSPEDAEKASLSDDDFREFIINYGRIEIL